MKAGWLLFAALVSSGCTVVVGDGSYQVQQTVASDGGGTPACPLGGGASACHQCIAAQCCAQSNACSADADCTSLLSCEASCADAACQSRCQATYPGGVGPFQDFLGCVTGRCAVCGQAGVGDACTSSSNTCAPGLTCGGAFCTRSCSGDADCAGAYDDGKNQSGGANVCALDASQATVCFPTCATSADCAHLPGTSCVSDSVAAGGTGQVCGTGS
ncbi:MAG TPA: hypothetical protein VIF15_03390 [Polyangiaceae bacterium]|jgi:hypothetical protein